jgi:cbb3-type cytochrome oxidase maturation protein
MGIIYILIPIAMVFVTIAIVVFFWAVKSNQYDDLDREGINILFDEDLPAPPISENTKDHQKTSKPSDLND